MQEIFSYLLLNSRLPRQSAGKAGRVIYLKFLGSLTQMQKKIIALAIAAAFSAPAFADTANVNVYGKVFLDVE